MDGFFVAKLKKFSNVIPTAPAGKGNIFSYRYMPTFSMIITLLIVNSPSVFVTNLEEENAEAPEATEVTDSPDEKPPKSDKTKKTVPGKTGISKEKVKANGTAAKKTANIQLKGKKDLPAGPKKAKIAKMDGQTVKGPGAKKPTDESKTSKADKKEGSRFEKKQAKKRKMPMKAKNRMGKNKFQKLKHMLNKQVGGDWLCVQCIKCMM